MRRQTLVSFLCLTFLTSSGLLLAASTGGQPVSDFLSPKDTVYRYFDSILHPALVRQSPSDDTVRAFYNGGLSDRTREQVSENQFTEYWRYVADRTARALLVIVDLKYSIGEPIESEAHDQALVLVTGSYQGPFDAPAIVGCVSDMHRSSSDCTERSRVDSGGEFEATYWIVREDSAWKLVLHDDLVREMQKLTRPVRRYRPNVAAAQEGLKIRVQEITLQTEATTLRLLIENTNDVGVGLRNALSLASLTDDRGVTFNTHILRSTIPETVPAHASAVADLTFVGNLTTFETVPVNARKLSLSLPYVRVRDSEDTLHLDIALRPLPRAAVIRTSMPGEPVLVYLLALLRPRYPTEETLKTLYQTLLSSETRGQVTEQEFVAYHQSAALDAWLCRLGVPDDFTIGVPTYPAPRQASIPVTTARRGLLPARIKSVTNVLTFRVVKEEDGWKLALQEDVVKEIKAHPSLVRRYHPDAEGGEGGIDVRVNGVELDTDRARVSLLIRNFNNRDISLANFDSATNLRVKEEGWHYPLNGSWGLPSVVQRDFGFPSVYAILEFGSIPLEARELWLTLGNFDTNKFSVTVKIVLDPASACP